MAKFRFQPWHFILLGILVLFAFQPEINPFLRVAYSVVDPDTNETYTCNTTLECYNQVGITGTEAAPAMVCSENLCNYAECVDGDDKRVSCPGGTSAIVMECVDGIWETVPGVSCPKIECTVDSDCIVAIDSDCDSELEAVQTSCISNSCTSPSYARCSEAQLFWGQYKIWIIGGILLTLGIGGFLYVAPKRIKLW